MTEFARRVREVVRTLPEGEVATYGEVAAMAGRPGAARGAGAVLAASAGEELPWWRVTYASGRLAPGKEAEQARRLRREGAQVDDADGVARLSPGGRQPRRPTARS